VRRTAWLATADRLRHTLGGLRAVTERGEASAVAVESDTTPARIIHLRDIVEIGDLVAPQR
jgi:hypothetical protein